MPPDSADLVRLTRIDAILSEETAYAYAKHTYYGWRQEAVEEYVWRRTYKPIGAGGFGAVYREECIQGSKQGAVRAVKHILKPTSSQRGVRIDYGRELEAIARFSRPEYEPFFVRSEGWFDAEDKVCIIMELVLHGSLQQYIPVGQGLPEAETKLLVKQVLQGVSHMHRAGYTHRDLKPQNLLVVQQGPAWQIKIADFGLSKRFIEDSTSTRNAAGTLGFIAPEVLGLCGHDDHDSDDSQDDSRPSHGNPVDLWAIGVISFLLLTGVLPFPSHNNKLLGKYVRGKAVFPMEQLQAKPVSAYGCDFIRGFLSPNPNDRPSADSSLQHIWLVSSLKRPPVPTPAQLSGFVGSASWNTRDSGYRTEIVSRPGSGDFTMGMNNNSDQRFHKLSQKPPRLNAKDVNYDKSPAPSTMKGLQRPRVDKYRRGMTPQRKDLTAAESIQSSSMQESFVFARKRAVLETHLQPYVEPCLDFAFSPSGGLLALEKYDSTTLWKVPTATKITKLVRDFRIAEDYRCNSSFSPDGKQFAYVGLGSGSAVVDGGSIRLCEAASGAELRRIDQGSMGSPRLMTFLTNSLLAVYFCLHGVEDIWRGALWNTETGKTVKKLPDLEGLGRGRLLDFSPNGKFVAGQLEGNDRERSYILGVWDVSTGAKICRIGGADKYARGVFSPDSTVIAVPEPPVANRFQPAFENSPFESFKIVKVADPKDLRRIELPPHTRLKEKSLTFSPSGRRIVGVTIHPEIFFEMNLRLWDLQTGAELSNIDLVEEEVNCARFTPDGKVLAFERHGAVELWDVVI